MLSQIESNEGDNDDDDDDGVFFFFSWPGDGSSK